MRKLLILLLMFTILAVNPVSAQYNGQSSDPQDGFSTVFTPQVNGIATYIDWLHQVCHKSLYVADYTFTSPEVAQAYCELAKRGVSVHIILDRMESKAVKAEAPLIAQLVESGCEVVITTSEQKHAIMHLKMSVADGLFVEDGSFNYTDAANNQANDLNFNLQPSPKRAALFMQSWQDLYNFAKSQ